MKKHHHKTDRLFTICTPRSPAVRNAVAQYISNSIFRDKTQVYPEILPNILFTAHPYLIHCGVCDWGDGVATL